jgi:lysophospholipase L1-like esterase
MNPKAQKIILITSLLINVLLIYFLLPTKEIVQPPQQEMKMLKDPDFFTEFFKVDNRVLFVGNSLIEQGNWSVLLDNPSVVNRGMSGLSSHEIFMRYKKLIDGRPKKIFFLMGINDLEQLIPEPLIMENFHRILYQLKATTPLTEVYFISVLPINPDINTEETVVVSNNEAVDKLNLTIRNFTDTFGIQYVDANLILKSCTTPTDSLYQKDGIHLTELGYEKISDLLKSKVEE